MKAHLFSILLYGPMGPYNNCYEQIKMKVWRIEGFNGLNKVYQEDINIGLLTEKRIQLLLQTLTAKESLDHSEIVGALVRRKSKQANNLLDVVHHKPNPEYSCGQNPYFTARVVTIEKNQ